MFETLGDKWAPQASLLCTLTCLHMAMTQMFSHATNNTNPQKIEPGTIQIPRRYSLYSDLCVNDLYTFNSSQPRVKYIGNDWFSLPTMPIQDFQGWGKASRTIHFKTKSLSFAVHRNRVTSPWIMSNPLNMSPHLKSKDLNVQAPTSILPNCIFINTKGGSVSLLAI